MAKYFEKIVLHSEYDKGLIHNVQLVDDEGKFLPIEAGDLVTVSGVAIDGMLSNLSGQEVKNYNGFETIAPLAVTDKVLLCDPATVSEVKKGNNTYRVGNETFGNVVTEGRMVRARELKVYDTFWLGADNFASTPTVGQYAGATVGSVKWTPLAEISTADGLVVKIETTKKKTTGAEAGFTVYAVRVVQE